MTIFTPKNNFKLDNVSVVKLRINKYRFELACYPNMVAKYRQNKSIRCEDVIQNEIIFSNLSKGQIAKSEDLLKAFKTTNKKEIIETILNQGEFTYNTKEREDNLDALRRDIAQLVAERCVDKHTSKPIPINTILKAMKAANISLKTDQNAKQQVYDVIQVILSKKLLSLSLSKVNLEVTSPLSYANILRERLIRAGLIIISESPTDSDIIIKGMCNPGCYEKIVVAVEEATSAHGSVYKTT